MVYSNEKFHRYTLEGQTADEHEAVIEELEHMMLVDSSKLLPDMKHCFRQILSSLLKDPPSSRYTGLPKRCDLWVSITGSDSSQDVHPITPSGHQQHVEAGLLPTKVSNLAKERHCSLYWQIDYPPLLVSVLFLGTLWVPLSSSQPLR